MEPLEHLEAGSGPLLVMLHGFPDIGLVWKSQMEALAKDFQILIPNLRGYGHSPRPNFISAYRMENLVDDVLALVAGRPVYLLGHDWGGIVAWTLAARRPDLVRRLALLNSPHPEALIRQLYTNPRQIGRSWLPEQVIMHNTRRWLASFHPGPPAYLDRVIESLARPGATSAAINYYRAAFRYRSPLGSPPSKLQPC